MTHHRNILFSLCGLSPQILTENLYCLLVEQKIWIDEIWMITTDSGKIFAQERLLDIRRGKFYEFCREYNIDVSRIQFSTDQIIATDDLADIWSLNDNEAFANILTRKLWELTRDDDAVLHCSIAGGRKSMSAYLAMLMQFFARPQDKLYHTLVHPAGFENHLEYFYPPIEHFHIRSRSGGIMSTADARLEMHEIPFIRLREKIPEFLQTYHSYSEMVQIAQKWIVAPSEFPQLVIEPKKKHIHIGQNYKICLPDFQMILYTYFAQNSMNRPDDVPSDDYMQYFIRGGENFAQEEINKILAMYKSDGVTLDWQRIQQEISKIKSAFTKQMPDFDLIENYLISKVGPWGAGHYGIKLDKEYILII